MGEVSPCGERGGVDFLEQHCLFRGRYEIWDVIGCSRRRLDLGFYKRGREVRDLHVVAVAGVTGDQSSGGDVELGIDNLLNDYSTPPNKKASPPPTFQLQRLLILILPTTWQAVRSPPIRAPKASIKPQKPKAAAAQTTRREMLVEES